MIVDMASLNVDTYREMNYNQVERHYGGQSKVAQALGLQRQTVHAWKARKRIPSRWQIKLEVLTGLKADKKARCEVVDLASWIKRNGNGHE